MNPFVPEVWPKESRHAAAALWAFHHALDALRPGTSLARDMDRCLAGESLEAVGSDVTRAVYAACRNHALDPSLLAAQIRAGDLLAEPVRFATAPALLEFIRLRCGAHARLLAQLTGQRGLFRIKGTEEFAKAVFLTKKLCRLKQDLANNRLFVPESELVQFGVSLSQLVEGRVDARVRRLLWKQSVRIRDAYGACQRLGSELTGWPGRHFRRQWMHGIYLVSAAERRKFDVWSRPVALSGLQKAQMRWQILFGKTSFT